MRAVVYLGEKDVQLVRRGDHVQVLLEQSRHTILEGSVQAIDADQSGDRSTTTCRAGHDSQRREG